MDRTVLIENGTLLSTGGAPSVRRNCSVLIEDGLITRIVPGGRIGEFAGRRLDAAGKVVMPGLINAHTHLYSAFARGLAATRLSRDFIAVLRNLWWRLDAALTPEDCYQSALVGLIDAIRHGATAVVDHHSSPGAPAGSLDAARARRARDRPARLPLLRGLRPRRPRGGARGPGREPPVHPPLPGRRRRRAARALRPARLLHALRHDPGGGVGPGAGVADRLPPPCGRSAGRPARGPAHLRQGGGRAPGQLRHPRPADARRALHPHLAAGNRPAGGDRHGRRAQPPVQPLQRGRRRRRTGDDAARRAGRPGHGRDDRQPAGGAAGRALGAAPGHRQPLRRLRGGDRGAVPRQRGDRRADLRPALWRGPGRLRRRPGDLRLRSADAAGAAPTPSGTSSSASPRRRSTAPSWVAGS